MSSGLDAIERPGQKATEPQPTGKRAFRRCGGLIFGLSLSNPQGGRSKSGPAPPVLGLPSATTGVRNMASARSGHKGTDISKTRRRGQTLGRRRDEEGTDIAKSAEGDGPWAGPRRIEERRGGWQRTPESADVPAGIRRRGETLAGDSPANPPRPWAGMSHLTAGPPDTTKGAIQGVWTGTDPSVRQLWEHGRGQTLARANESRAKIDCRTHKNCLS